MLHLTQDSQVAAATAEPGGSDASYEEKRRRALQILGERWVLHRANSPNRRPASSVLARAKPVSS